MSEITCVICHYNPEHRGRLQNLVSLCVETLLSGDMMGVKILVCDGSPEPDAQLQSQWEANAQVMYLHSGEQLSFGATYNLGIDKATSDVVVLIANDVLISADQIKRLVADLQGSIGCVLPYLTESDYATQARKPGRVVQRCFPSSMTINVNAFRRETLLAIGGVPEMMRGAYNDMVIFQRLRERGEHIMLKHVGKVVHIGRVTRHSYDDTVRMAQDREAALGMAPAIFEGTNPTRRNDWAWLFANQAQKRWARWLWRIVAWLPWTVHQQRGVGYWASRLEPILTRARPEQII